MSAKTHFVPAWPAPKFVAELKCDYCGAPGAIVAVPYGHSRKEPPPPLRHLRALARAQGWLACKAGRLDTGHLVDLCKKCAKNSVRRSK